MGPAPQRKADGAIFVPGLGSLVNGDVGKGIGIFLGWCVSWVLTIVLIGVFGLLGFWIWGHGRRVSGARRWNAADGVISGRKPSPALDGWARTA